jgi:hypothetical protein
MENEKSEYRAAVTKDILVKWNGLIRVWDKPQSAVEGAEVVDKITEPLQVKVVDAQNDMWGATLQRVKIAYGDTGLGIG